MPAYTSFTIAGPGNLGGHIAKALLKQGFKVSVLSRSGSSANAKTLEAAGANIQAVDYSDASSVAEALAGSQVVINTLGIAALQGSAQDILIEQSKKAGVQLYVPSDWGFSYDFAEKSGVSIHPFIHAKTTVEAQLEKVSIGSFTASRSELPLTLYLSHRSVFHTCTSSTATLVSTLHPSSALTKRLGRPRSSVLETPPSSPLLCRM